MRGAAERLVGAPAGRDAWTRDGRPREARPQADEHAVEMAVARLRRGLGRPGIVETVVKRGYRLACDPRLADRLAAGAGG